MVKVLIDTDIGDDIDDAFAIALACASREIDLVGITTVFRNTAARAKQAAMLLDTAGKANVPVYVGETTPLSGKFPLFHCESNVSDPTKTLPCQYDGGMDGCPVCSDAPGNIIRLSREYKGELTVVTIGAATNLARAIQRDPSVVRNVKKVVMMGGWFTNFVPEWNVLCDPEAMDILFKSGVDVYAVGLDVTLQCGLEQSLLDKFRSSGKPVNKLLTVWLNRWFEYFNFDKSVMHDPLALATLLNDEICTFDRRYVKVVTDGEKRGAIAVSDVPAQGFSPVNVAVGVNKQIFYGEVANRLL